MSRELAMISNIISSVFLGGAAGFCVLIFPLWDLRPSDLMSPGADRQWNEYALGYGIAVPLVAFIYLVPVALILSWLFFARGRYRAAVICGWLPLVCPLVTVLVIIVTLVLSKLTSWR